jgi:hypothetical protein
MQAVNVGSWGAFFLRSDELTFEESCEIKVGATVFYMPVTPAVSRDPLPSTYDEPTVMWRMRRSDGLSAHAVIGLLGRGAWVIWFMNGKPVGVRDFDDLTTALQWSERMQFQNWTVGWRDISLSTETES